MSPPVPYPSGGKIQKQTSMGFRRDLWVPGAFDYDVFEDKFWGDALRDLYPAAKLEGTGGAAVTFTEHNANGFIEIISGTTNGGYAGQGIGLQFTGDRGVLAEFIVTLPAAITGMKFEVGLTDADNDAGAINQKATTSTFTAVDCAVFVYDTNDDANLAAISAIGGSGTESQDLVALAASTTYRMAIRVNGDQVQYYLNDSLVASHGAAIQGGNALTPWVFVQARTGSNSRTLQLNKWRCTQPAY